MALQFSTTLRNAMLDSIETTAGTSARVNVFSGAAPANTAVASAGTFLAQFALAADWASNAAEGSKAFSGLPVSTTASAAGTAGYFRIMNSANSVCIMQGTVGQGTGDLSLDNTNIASGQTIQITSWTITAPGA